MTKPFHFQEYIQEMWKHMSIKNLYMNSHNSIIYNSPKVETAQMFKWWMNKQNWCIHMMAYYLATKSEEYWGAIEHLLDFVATFADSEKSHHQHKHLKMQEPLTNESQVFVTAKRQWLKSGTEKINE